MLDGYLSEMMQKDAWQAYTAQMMWYTNMITFKRFGSEFRHPTWLEMIGEKMNDERNGKDIVHDLAEKFARRAERR